MQPRFKNLVIEISFSEEKFFIDKTNFKTNFRNNKALFKGLDDEEHVELSADGKAELAEAILELVK